MARRRALHRPLAPTYAGNGGAAGATAALFEAGRVEAFSDGVFAIAITLIVLELKVPELPRTATDADLLAALAALEPTLLSYLISFAVIGGFWMSHHRFFRAVHRIKPGVLWLNLLVLLFVSFLPFPTAILGAYANLAVAQDLYALALAGAGLLFAAMIWYAARAGLIEEALLDVPRRIYMTRALVLPLVAVVVIAMASVAPRYAPYAWWLLAVCYIALGRVGRRRGR